MKLGQHMLVNRAILNRILSYAELESDDVVLEVGCGTGNLTEALLSKAKVIGIEKDPRLVALLEKRFAKHIASGKLLLIKGDALEVEFPPFSKFVSNIPYEISSPLIFKLLRHGFRLAVIMLQREFAERLVGEDSRLGIISKAYCRAELLEIVDRENFRPVPMVDSAIVRLKPVPAIEVRNRELFEHLVTFAFSMRRKKLGKILREFEKRTGLSFNIGKELADMRPEELGASNFARIVDDLRAC